MYLFPWHLPHKSFSKPFKEHLTSIFTPRFMLSVICVFVCIQYLVSQTNSSFGEILPLSLKVPLLLTEEHPLLFDALFLLQRVAVVQQSCRLLVTRRAQLLLQTHTEPDSIQPHGVRLSARFRRDRKDQRPSGDLFSHLADAFIQRDLQMRTIEAI